MFRHSLLPKKKYSGRLTQQEVIDLLASGKYIVDAEAGQIYSARTGEKLYTYTGGRDTKRRWVRLFSYPKKRSLPVAHCVWLFKTRSPIPRDFHIHHRNECGTDDRWKNLFALHRLDHEKLHRDDGAMDDIHTPTPF